VGVNGDRQVQGHGGRAGSARRPEVAGVLDRRAALKHPPATLAVSDAVALGIAGILRSPTPSGQVLERFYRSGSADSAELIEAARTEQGYASPEGHAALYCLIGWVDGQLHARGRAGEIEP
jgi:hypothetical protein